MNKIIALSLVIPGISYAFFCPNNFNQINIGDSTDQVLQQCGKPDKQEEKKQDAPVPQEWSYYIPQNVALSMGKTQGQGSVKMSVMMDKDGKVSNISINGMGIGSSTICGGKTIKIGDNSDSIKTACGNPAIVNKQDTADAPAVPPVTVDTYYYNSTPPQKLIFENGLLTKHE